MPDEVGDNDNDVPWQSRLGDSLQEFAALYDRSSTDDGRREAGLQQLMAIADHLHALGTPGDVLRPLTAIIHGLIEVGENRTPPIFKTQNKGGGQTIPFDEQRQRGLAAAVVTLLIDADDGQDDKKLDRALTTVATRIRNWRAVRRRRVWSTDPGSLREAVKDWRNKAMTGHRSDPDAGIYSIALTEHVRSGQPALQFAEWLLNEGVTRFTAKSERPRPHSNAASPYRSQVRLWIAELSTSTWWRSM